MDMCQKCHSAHKENGWYLGGNDKLVTQDECQVHPVQHNWRVQRTLNTLQVWGADDHYTVSVDRGCKVEVSLEDGWIHLRNAFLKLFDYERPFVDLLLKEGLLETQDCVRTIGAVQPRSVRVTMKGSVWLKELQLRKEAKKELEAKIATERALA